MYESRNKAINLKTKNKKTKNQMKPPIHMCVCVYI